MFQLFGASGAEVLDPISIADSQGGLTERLSAWPIDPPFANSKPSLTHDQAGSRITRANLKWSPDADGITRVTFAFRNSFDGGLNYDFARFISIQMTKTVESLTAWSDVANIEFTRVGSGLSGDDAYSDNATMLFANFTNKIEGLGGYGYYPANRAFSSTSGDAWFYADPRIASLGDEIISSYFSYLSYVPHLISHEIGHALGLAHPGNYDVTSGRTITYADDATYLEDTRQYTIMSYFDAANSGAKVPGDSQAPMIHDIVAMQSLYGANMRTRVGDTVYGFHSTADRDWFSSADAKGARPVMFCVWDAGGIDSFDFSGYENNQKIDLNSGQFSDIGGWIGNVSIAPNVVIENAIGGSGNDALLGNDADNLLNGGAGNDRLIGAAGNDRLIGGLGDDVLDGGIGNDTADYSEATSAVTIDLTVLSAQNTGGAGMDTLTRIENLTGSAFDDVLTGDDGANILVGGGGNDVLDGGRGIDTASYAKATSGVTVALSIAVAQDTGGDGRDRLINIENLIGSSFNDSLMGDGSDNVIDGGAGNDLLSGGAGNDRLDGGAGLDIASYAEVTTNLTINLTLTTAQSMGSAGNDTLISIEGLIGGSGNDSLTGNSDNNILEGGLGNDRLDGGAGLDVASFAGLTAGIEIDLSNFSGTITTALGTDTLISIEGLIGGSGNDVLKAGATATYLDGGAGNDFLGGSAFADTLIGGAGDDGIAAGAGNDSLDGGDGDDTLLGQAGDDTISGGAGRDFIDGGDGADTINAGDANDLINGGNGNDIINGDAGNDSIYGDAGNDIIDGGAGDDDLSGGNDNDTITGGAGDDRIAGGYGNDILNGGDGNDTISANDGDDTITGGAGVDNLYGFTGNDTIDGGDGNDTLLGMEGDDLIRGGTGADYIVGGDGTDTLYGDDGDDNMQGNDGNDTLNGGLGNDGLDGGAGNDTLNGDAGNDYLGGGEGNDILNGGDGNDVFVGGAGKDTLTGGAGADAFFFTALTDSTAAAPDKITDFSWADGDYINLSQIDANTSLAGDQAFSFVNSFTKQAGQATLTYDAASNTSTFSADVDGDGVADFVLQVSGQQDTSHGWVL